MLPLLHVFRPHPPLGAPHGRTLVLIRQLLVSLVVVALAVAGYVFLYPGAPDQLARLGLIAPPPPAAAQAPAGGQAQGAGAPGAAAGQGQQAAAGGGGGQRPAGGGGGFGGRGGARTMVVVASPVVMATINDKLTAIGEGAAARSVTVVSPAAGTLAELDVQPGQSVAAGDVLGKLDSEAEAIAYKRAELASQDADATLKRAQELASANNATTVQVTTAQLAADNARLALQNADLDLKRRTITTPIAGTVGLFQANPGNTVTTQTVITTIEDSSHIRVSFWVPERYAPAIRPGMDVVAAAVALPGQSLSGTVSAVDNKVDPTSRTLEVQADVANTDGQLKPGMSFSVSLTFAGEQFAAVDPLAIQWSSSGAYVWKLVDGKAQRTTVEIIQRNSDGVLVRGDLAAGDQVVTQGVQQLTPNATVRLLDEDGAAGGQRPAGNAGAAPAAGGDAKPADPAAPRGGQNGQRKGGASAEGQQGSAS